MEFVRIGRTAASEEREFGGPLVVVEVEAVAVLFWWESGGRLRSIMKGVVLCVEWLERGREGLLLLEMEVMRSTSMLGWDEGCDEDVAEVRLEAGSPVLLRAAVVSKVRVVDVESVGMCIGIGASCDLFVAMGGREDVG